jgi:hypothetical protein
VERAAVAQAVAVVPVALLLSLARLTQAAVAVVPAVASHSLVRPEPLAVKASSSSGTQSKGLCYGLLCTH